MDIVWKKDTDALCYNGKCIHCSCNVRNELNGLRKSHELVYTIPNHNPYMPRVFPEGTWQVFMPEPRTGPEKYPYFILTSAYRIVEVWDVENGKYTKPNGIKDKDIGYGIHYSEYHNTLGCIKIEDISDLLVLVNDIKAALSRNEQVRLTVE